jgi:hypothetical protein
LKLAEPRKAAVTASEMFSSIERSVADRSTGAGLQPLIKTVPPERSAHAKRVMRDGLVFIDWIFPVACLLAVGHA